MSQNVQGVERIGINKFTIYEKHIKLLEIKYMYYKFHDNYILKQNCEINIESLR